VQWEQNKEKKQKTFEKLFVPKKMGKNYNPFLCLHTFVGVYACVVYCFCKNKAVVIYIYAIMIALAKALGF
jgi:hypothetical protein